MVKAAATDMRYFARSKFSKSLVHKKNFSLIWQDRNHWGGGGAGGATAPPKNF